LRTILTTDPAPSIYKSIFETAAACKKSQNKEKGKNFFHIHPSNL
jgi:hypothetical protein